MPSETNLTRRTAIRRMGAGFGSIALAAMLAETRNACAGASLAPREPQFEPRAKRVIFLFMEGGPSHLDLFDYKPELAKFHDTKLPFDELPQEIREGKAEVPENFGNLLGPVARFARFGESDQWMSSYIPHMHQHADKLCVLKGMRADSISHGAAVQQMHTGDAVFTRPSMGAWSLYGLGTENENMPGYVAVSAPAGDATCGNAFLPAAYRATLLADAGRAEAAQTIRYLSNPDIPPSVQSVQLEQLRKLNQAHLRNSGTEPGLEGLIESFELAFRMQSEAVDVLDVSRESSETRRMYGIDEEPTDRFGRQCLIARRLSEAGVRFVQVTYTGWDSHERIKEAHLDCCQHTDKPVAGLLTDLQRRGLLDDTLVIWTGEFGRTPIVQNDKGRGHNPWGFSLWLAGGGVKGGLSYGETDPLGFQATQSRVHIHDLHATILYLLGLDHERLTYRHAGRDFRLTDLYGNVVTEILA